MPNDIADYAQGFSYIYQYKDHLGNVRLLYSDSDGNGSIDPTTEIIEEKNYYPFGLKHKGYNNVVSPNANSIAGKFQYNGKEIQDELGLGWYDYGARNYQPDLGRWMNIDPMVEEYKSYSGYNYSLNSPINYNDHDGSIVRDSEGNVVFEATEGQTTDRRTVKDVSYGEGGIRKVVEIRSTYQNGNIFADNGTKINAFSLINATQVTTFYNNSGEVISTHESKVDSNEYDCKANCHGRTFADNNLVIENDEVTKILENDGYESVEEIGAEIAIFSLNGEVEHSAVRVFDGTYENNAGILKNESVQTVQEANRSRGNRVHFFFKPNPDFQITDERINNLGTVKNGVRKITDKNQIAELIELINGN